jgi:hypothetical protein
MQSAHVPFAYSFLLDGEAFIAANISLRFFEGAQAKSACHALECPPKRQSIPLRGAILIPGTGESQLGHPPWIEFWNLSGFGNAMG